ncbi:MAG: hypothetical protein ACOZCL_00625 [Bacillota bacterium]
MRCDVEGNIKEVISDSINIINTELTYGSLASVVEKLSIAKAINFIREIKEKGTAMDWDINFQAGTDIVVYTCLGLCMRAIF